MQKAGIIVAGGIGSRFGGRIPKQFLELGGKRVIEYSIDKFINLVDKIIIVCHPEWIDVVSSIVHFRSNISIVQGGDTRQLSVYNGLKELEEDKPEFVAIHDSVRPLFTPGLLKKCFDSAENYGSGVAAILSYNTLAQVENNNIHHFLDRDTIFQIQTPQVFIYEHILRAHQLAYDQGMIDYTDDSQLLTALSQSVRIVEGEAFNIKITHPIDLSIAELLLELTN